MVLIDNGVRNVFTMNSKIESEIHDVYADRRIACASYVVMTIKY